MQLGAFPDALSFGVELDANILPIRDHRSQVVFLTCRVE